MANQTTSKTSTAKLVQIKKRLRAGKLTTQDIKTLEKFVMTAERAAKALRAAMVE